MRLPSLTSSPMWSTSQAYDQTCGTGSGIAPAEVDGLLTDLGLDFALLSSAAALVDMGTSSHAPGADRLGVVRPQGAAVDVGPYEVMSE